MNFKKLWNGGDPAPVLDELKQNENFWDIIKIRQLYEGSAHKDTEMIPLRGPRVPGDILENLDAVNYPQFYETLPRTKSYLRRVLVRLSYIVEEERRYNIGRIMLVRLKAGGFIEPHYDSGKYARFFARFHAPLSSNEGCKFTCGDSTVHMEPGSLWWFNHQRVHSFRNSGDTPRIHLIIDAQLPGYTGALENPL